MRIPMLLDKKPVRRLPPVAASPGDKVFFLPGTGTSQLFLVDTGACESLIPKSLAAKLGRRGKTMKAANGTGIQTYGRQKHTITCGNKKYEWNFLIADVSLPIIGADFFNYFDLAVDMRRKRLVPLGHTSQQLHQPVSQAAAVREDDYNALRAEYADVFSDSLQHKTRKTVNHGIRHHITTQGPPVFARFRRLSPENLAAAKKCFEEMEAEGICQKGSSPWASPLHIVTKPDGSLRPCGDYRRLNLVTEADHYPLPNISDITTFLNGARIFSKLDMTKGYYQVPMNKDDIPKTAVTTPFGTYTFNFSCFGLKNSGATFQRLMDGILGDLPFCACYVDDVLIFSASHQQHQQHLKEVLTRLRANGMLVKPTKCILGAKEVEFLGHKISSEGASPLPSKVSAIRDFPTPSTIKQLQEFLGMVTFYNRFLPGIASILTPLTDLLKGKPKELLWSTEADVAFARAKHRLATAAQLAYPDARGTLALITDASDNAVGAVLQQQVNGIKKPLGFYNKKLSKAQQNYATFDRELLAVFLATDHFKHLLEGRTFKILTDHLPLVHAFKKKSDQNSARQQRHLAAISEFNCTLEHLPGKNNTVADALSRNISAAVLGLDIQRLHALQKEEEEEAKAYNSLQLIKINEGNTSLLCDVSTGRPRPWIPKGMRKTAFKIIHNLAHPSRRASVKLMKEKFVWEGIKKDSLRWAKECIACQSAKTHRHTETGIGHFAQPTRRFSHIHVDIVGPLPASNNFKYLFTAIDRSTRWPEAIPMATSSSADCVAALLNGWISRFGIPDIITSDRGTQFTSTLWEQLASKLGVTATHTTSYNPEANGIVERFHRSLKAALTAACRGSNWSEELPWVLLGLRTTPKEPDDISIAEKVYGDALRVPGDFFGSRKNQSQQQLRQEVDKYIPCQPTFTDNRRRYTPPNLKECSHVFIRVDLKKPPLSPPYTGPYKVIERNEKTYKIDARGRYVWISIDRLKPAYLSPEDIPTSRAGRPLVRLSPRGE